MLAIGLMSGTSVDGVDACLVEIKGLFKKQYLIKDFFYLAYDKKIKTKILDCSKIATSNVQKICSLNVEISQWYARAIEQLLINAKVNIKDISFIAMHGQTVWHNPENMDGYESSTLQLGDPAILAERFNVKVISNFRSMDMAAGGNGAPLVPFANYILYHSKYKNIALQNIGGIGNVTFLKKNSKVDDIIAFDTGPGNILIDAAMERLFHCNFDDCGKVAKRGKVIEPVLNELMHDNYLYLDYPKSTGREKYSEAFLSEIILKIRSEGGTDNDIITTLTAYTADSICLEYQKFLPKIDLMIVSGGGVFNEYLVERLVEKMPCEVKADFHADSLEALSFAVLGYQTLKHYTSNVPHVTGARKKVVQGSVTDPFVRKRQ